MTVNVPTAEEFAALEQRVTVLEQGQPRPPDPNPDVGEQAKRAVDLIELFGVNTFSSLDEHNVWGSWPADYRPEQVIAALNWITAGSGYALRIREYHYKGREASQQPWLRQIAAAIPDTRVSLCVGANGSPADVPSMLALEGDASCNVEWIEGLNEPNTDFGSGEVPFDVTLAIQQAIDAGAVREVMGPSIVAGMPNPGGWITGYCGDGITLLNDCLIYGNGHYYPPTCPDLIGSGTSVSEYVASLSAAYGDVPMMLTEFHPTLYNADGNAPKQPGWNGQRDAYYTLLTLLRCGKLGDIGLWWYALFDYGSTYECGLFPTNAENPRPSAQAIRTLCTLCADNGDRYGFTPTKLDVKVSGLPQGADYDLYQISNGTFLLPLWWPDVNLGGPAIPVSITLDKAAQMSEWNVVTGEQLQQPRQDTTLVSHLDAGVRLVIITP